VLGLLSILIGMLLPAIGAARSRARLARNQAAIQQCFLLVTLYANAHGDLYPVASDRLTTACLRWYEPILNDGLADAPEQLDAIGIRTTTTGKPTFGLSMCAMYDPKYMIPGSTLPLRDARTIGVRQSQVQFPSDKGLMWQWWVNSGKVHANWCCLPWRPEGPVVMADGSGVVKKWTDFRLEHEPEIDRQMGIPVQSTWLGYKGRDR
jgi:type II secretory pathway pseudopilin PulG